MKEKTQTGAAHVLVIEDDDIVARTIERSLRGDEFRVSIANSGVEGLKLARRHTPDLVILDIIMPGMDGYAVCREMRADPLLAETPILFLTAKIKDEDKIAGFSAGADDYLTKPFNIDELILRLRAILRRVRKQMLAEKIASAAAKEASAAEKEASAAEKKASVAEKKAAQQAAEEPAPGAEGHFGARPSGERFRIALHGYILDTRSYELYTPQGAKVRLTPVQYELLHHLMRHPGEIFSPGRLLDEVWDYPSDTGSPDLVRVHIKNLRERIEADPRRPTFIRTVPGYGYTISPEGDSQE